MRVIALLLAICLSAIAQSPTVVISDADSRESYTVAYLYDGSSNLTTVCKTRSNQADTSTFSIDASTLTSIVVLTNVGTVTTASEHGLAEGNEITVSGETGDTDLNDTYTIQSVTSTTVFTITTASVSDDTYDSSGVQFTTDAPLLTSSIWSVRSYEYDSSDNLIRTHWADGDTQPNNACVATAAAK